MNKYTYCRNNAVRFVDPLGLYDRDAAADYARKYGEDGEYNSEYLGFDRTIDRIKYAITNGTTKPEVVEELIRDIEAC